MNMRNKNKNRTTTTKKKKKRRKLEEKKRKEGEGGKKTFTCLTKIPQAKCTKHILSHVARRPMENTSRFPFLCHASSTLAWHMRQSTRLTPVYVTNEYRLIYVTSDKTVAGDVSATQAPKKISPGVM